MSQNPVVRNSTIDMNSLSPVLSTDTYWLFHSSWEWHKSWDKWLLWKQNQSSILCHLPWYNIWVNCITLKTKYYYTLLNIKQLSMLITAVSKCFPSVLMWWWGKKLKKTSLNPWENQMDSRAKITYKHKETLTVKREERLLKL